MTSLDPVYTVIIRVPFPRGNFVDPPFVDWDASKDKQLWKILSNTSKNIDIDWNKLAVKFQVPLAFLLQQVACLYERQMKQVQAQIRKVRDVIGLSTPAAAGLKSDSGGEVTRMGHGVAGISRDPNVSGKKESSTIPLVTPALANAREISVPMTTLNNMTTTNEPIMSRNSSRNTTVISSELKQSSTRTINVIANREIESSLLHNKSNSCITTPVRTSQLSTTSSSESSSEDSSSSSELPLNSLLRRPARFSDKLAQSKLEHEDEDEDEMAFMPLEPHGQDQQSCTSLAIDTQNKNKLIPGLIMHRDTSEKLEIPNSTKISIPDDNKNSQVKDKCRETNDGIPSMCSSFSDLDDTSITQSALEEALASNMQAGGMASRMSSISHALRSKYL